MPIEFICTECSRLLRVSDDSEGKRCRCPGCQTLLKVTKSDLRDDRKSTSVVSEPLLVPCPKCQHLLQCTKELIGTRGCCPACANVFTISVDGSKNQEERQSDSFPFACPRCKQLFEGKPESAGRKGKCTNCSEVFVIEKYTPPEKPKVSASIAKSKPIANRPRDQKQTPILVEPIAYSAPEEPTDMLSSIDLFEHLPPQDLAAPTYYPPIANTPIRPVSSPVRRKKNKGSGSGLLKILGIVGGIFGLCLFICCGVGLLALGFATSKSSISVAGYSVQAPGVRSAVPNNPNFSDGKAIRNPLTGSEFGMLIIRMPNSLHAVTPELVASNMERSGLLRNKEIINRAGLTGLRYQALADPSRPAHTGELFPIKDGVLLVLYVSGYEISMAKKGRSSISERSCTSRDNPDAFFESLQLSATP